MTEPMVRALSSAGHKITVAVLPHIAPVYRSMSCVDEVLEWSFNRKELQIVKRWQIANSIKGQFDNAVICPNSFKNALIPFFSSIKNRVGYEGELRGLLLSTTIPNPDKSERGSMVNFYKKIALTAIKNAENIFRKKGLEPNYFDSLKVSLQSMDPEHAPLNFLEETPLPTLEARNLENTLNDFRLAKMSYIVLAPGAEYGPAKRWPIEKFTQLAINISLGGSKIVLMGSKSDVQECLQIEKVCKSRNVEVTNLSGQTDLTQAIALIGGSNAVISNDSGLMHIAAALKRPQVAIFGSSSPLHTPPLNSLAKVLWLSLECSPCFKRACPLGHLNCLKNITVGEVESALEIIRS